MLGERVVNEQFPSSLATEAGVEVEMNDGCTSSQPAFQVLAQQLVHFRRTNTTEKQSLRGVVLTCRHCLPESRHPMSSNHPQCFESEQVPIVTAVVEGSKTVPDPRSLWENPRTVHLLTEIAARINVVFVTPP